MKNIHENQTKRFTETIVVKPIWGHDEFITTIICFLWVDATQKTDIIYRGLSLDGGPVAY